MLVIDRTKVTLPIECSLYSVRLTYGRAFDTLVSAENPKEAVKIAKSVYDYLNPKVLGVQLVSEDHEVIHNRTKELILGKLDTMEENHMNEWKGCGNKLCKNCDFLDECRFTTYEKENNMKGLEKFRTEIKTEVDKVKDEKKKKYAEMQGNAILKHIESVCDDEYDSLLNQAHKSFRRMWKFITEHAKEYAFEGCAMVADSVVYGWIDEYVGLDDKKEVEEEEKKKSSSINVDKEIAKVQAEIKREKETTQLSVFDLF